MPLSRVLFYLATLASLTLLVHAIVVVPPPVEYAILALLAYMGLCAIGVLFARFSMFADVITLGPKNARGIALTFDDGPDPEHTPKVLDLLDRYGAKATFFMIGKKAAAHPDVVREVQRRGHAIGAHSHEHNRVFALRSPRYVRGDLERCLTTLEEILGQRPTLFRPPVGHVSPTVGRVVRELELQMIGWSTKGQDGWSGAKPDDVVARVTPRLRDGAIVLLHDASERGDFVPASIEALPKILEEARSLGLSFVRVDSWLEDDAPLADEAHDLVG